ncbi:RNase H domain-containing protein [Trichonephila clavipes]|nr:RNase H domain-containing protein [Trichonephila clavipes]
MHKSSPITMLHHYSFSEKPAVNLASSRSSQLVRLRLENCVICVRWLENCVIRVTVWLIMLWIDGSTTVAREDCVFMSRPVSPMKEGRFVWVSSVPNEMRVLYRVARNSFGINSNVSSLIYKQGIVPFICYGSRIWGSALKKKINCRLLRKIQRRILLRVISGYRTISYEDVFAISDFPPIDIFSIRNNEFKFATKNCTNKSLDGSLRVSELHQPLLNYFLLTSLITVQILKTTFQLSALQMVAKSTLSDSPSSLCALNNINSQNKLIVKTHINLNFLRSRGVQVYFSFVRGHTGIYGNKRADWLAKEATKVSDLIPMSIPKSYHKKVYKEKIISEWNNLYEISINAHFTKEFIPSIQSCLKDKHFHPNLKLTQFLTGHGNFKAYLMRFNLSPIDQCSCSSDTIQNAKHMILACTKFHSERRTLKRTI